MCGKIVLSKRMHAVASLVTPGNSVCDVGCDHGFVPIYLVKQGIAPRALAMDVNEGPLRQAKEHIAAFGLESYIETRISDGIASCRPGEADSLICAGMGGKLMQRILSEEKEKTDSFQELILQPQSELQQFRSFLRREGYLITDENMIEEDGKFYPMMKAVPKKETIPQGDSSNAYSQKQLWQQRIEDRYGPVLLKQKNSVLYRYLEREKRICEEVLINLQKRRNTASDRGKREKEVEGQIQDCLRVLELFDKREGAGYGKNKD